MSDIEFWFDYASPYSYLASERIEALIPEAEWRPLAFGFLLREVGKVPWSWEEDRAAHFAAIDERAAARGLPPVRYPDGWPKETWSVIPLRAALVAAEAGRLREFSHGAFRAIFADGRSLADIDTTLEVATAAGLDREAVRAGIERPEIKEALQAQTAAARDLGVTGVPTIAVGEQVFWGDDRLEEAAAAARAAA